MDFAKLNKNSIIDVAIIGAGPSGLACGLKLVQSNSDLRLVVLEARDRVGGRTLSDTTYKNFPIDVGGQWVGPKQTKVLQLVEKYQIELDPQRWFENTNSKPSEVAKSTTSLSLCSGASHVSPEDEGEFVSLIQELEKMAATVVGPPWTECPNAVEWDSISAQDFCNKIANPGIKRELELLIQAVMAADPDKLSFFYFLYYVNKCGGISQLGDGDGGAQSFRLKGGYQNISVRMGKDIVSSCPTASIKFECPVRKVTRIDDDKIEGIFYEVDYVDGGAPASLRARHVVIAMPPPLWKRIEFSPQLPTQKQDLLNGMYMGAAVKCIMVFSEAFWVADDSSQPVTFGKLETLGPIANLFPTTVAGSPAVVGLITGSEAINHFLSLPEAEKQTCLIDQLKKYFGRVSLSITPYSGQPAEELANSPGMVGDGSIGVEYFVYKCWIHEEYSQGCFAGLMPPGLATTVGDIKEPVIERIHDAVSETSVTITVPDADKPLKACEHAGIHFTCCELADAWPGYVEGAVNSGYRAAQEIINEF